MQKKKILVFLGHSDKETLCGELASNYENGARAGGHEVRRVNIGDMQFDPILHKGYKVIQELEPDLLKLQDDFRWANHIVILYPNWWGTMPAILKGLFDRFYIPGFAFRFHKTDSGWDKLLSGRTGRVIITMDSSPLKSRILFGDNSNEIKDAILGFAGIRTCVKKFGPLKKLTPDEKTLLDKKVFEMGKKAR